jgi:hypothetical protein
MRSLILSLVAGGSLLAAAPAAADSLPYHEAFTSPAQQPEATRVVHDGTPYAEAFSTSPVRPAPARPALGASAPYAEVFADTSPAVPASAATAAMPEAPATACTCPNRHG